MEEKSSCFLLRELGSVFKPSCPLTKTQQSMLMQTIKTIIVDNHDLFREGVKFALSKYPDLHIIGEAQNGSEYLKLLGHQLPDIVLMDIDMPIMNGIGNGFESHTPKKSRASNFLPRIGKFITHHQ